MRHIILISGKDSLATSLVQRERAPDLPYEYIFNEVGWELPETYEWLDRVELHLGREIIRLGDDLEAIVDEENCLPLPMRRFCTRRAKIKPLYDFLGSEPAQVYFGLRADEQERAGHVRTANDNIYPVYPLRELGMDLPAVWRFCEGVDLMPPLFHWEWMESRVRHLLNGDDWLLDSLEPWERAACLAWRSRNNCSICFFKRLYEWIGLHEHYPDAFSYGARLESKYAHRDEHGWLRPGQRLPSLLSRAGEIKEKRARQIVKYLRSKQQLDLFDDGDDANGADLLAVTSCGLFCGK